MNPDEFSTEHPKLALSGELIEHFAEYALATNKHGAHYQGMVDRGEVVKAVEIEDPEGRDPGDVKMKLVLLPASDEVWAEIVENNPTAPDKLPIAEWPVSICIPNQN